MKDVNAECTEFLVVLPIGPQFDDPAVLKRIAEALHEEFPEAVFTVADGDRGENFAVYPILGKADSGQPMARMPAEGIVAAISDFLEENFATIRKPMLH
ncbi:hypothetical protein [Pseudaminobacter sp. NGMCC 1.201702]|uniref:hypothetical protein n=1 Tax=Pseudaminobacter sp. NGMCC 1.201702 TaxID=3391825 RepID=UPI0039F038AE